MADIRPVTDRFAVAPQLQPEDLPALAGRFRLIVNNRPDGEETGQPCGEAIAAAAEAAGLAYREIPIRGHPGRAEVAALRAAVDGAGGPVLAFCRSGTRSIMTWALAEAEAGRPLDELARLGADAGYDLRPLLASLA
jgi:uncharacterized protein (TIGR01244 family)